MKASILLSGALASLAIAAIPSGPAKTYAACQKKTCNNPFEGCPPDTIFVSKTSKHANFTTIQDAIASLPHDTTAHTILIAPGIYVEQLNVTRPGPLTLLGMTDSPSTGISYSASGNATAGNAQNEVQVLFNATNHNVRFPDNAYTSVLSVGPTLNATLTGSGPTGFPVPADTPFGCADFRAYNIDFRNDEYPYSNGPAHAVGVSRANAGFYSCGLYGWQDTLYVGKLGNAYFYDNVIAGQTDFLYGFGTAYIEKSTLSLRNCGGGITAWKGTNTTFENKYGVYISDSQVLAANASVAPTIRGACALGRPWNAQHRSIFMQSFFDASIKPQGYIEWQASEPRVNNYTFMAVYDDRGPGWTPEQMKASNVTIVLDDAGAAPYREPKDVFQTPEGEFGFVSWVDQSVLRS
ncbi:pectinesterase [Colletotrichum paranaense]|uniref:pectinesterase n=4 Tax=Colletotrichum acutatum species complex TaxID=2707335 RepID=A0A9Q8STQ9_9PEZI|nr:pectinesterase [Colletotrichum lupini]XP_060304735.1 pectinesterase [Colletotrichum costaricense]XP_060346782.1 pectinesterase [Colletotrichum paranaense]XP_060379809.1 pectinesterase [Colletotrichum tamarilloi]KAK1493136.1 pectinesterase [Colletotrichum tamarilloi]KAK1506411.1 pectinesterase [Colletotrichum costaricense]KAK1533631.1 pectinesterase [Colletotrichum paranaense]UQC83389.1 pectinesterase [Colletotrichum lupini]